MTQLPWQFYLLLLAASVLLFCAAVAWRKRQVLPGYPLALGLLLAALWPIVSALDICTVSLEEKIFWFKVRFSFLPFLPVLFLEAVFRYARGRRLITRRKAWVFLLVPFITVAMVWYPGSVKWLRSQFHVADFGTFPALLYQNGPWIWVYYIYSYVLAVYGLILLVGVIRGSPPAQQKVNGLLLVVFLVPIIADVSFLFGLSPTPGFNYTPVTFAVTGCILVWLIFRYQFFDLAPVARAALVEQLKDYLVVLDKAHSVVDLNAAAAAALGIKFDGPGRIPFSQVLKHWPGLLVVHFEAGEQAWELRLDGTEGMATHECKVLSIPEGSHNPTAFMLLLRDITLQKEAEFKLCAAKELAEETNRAKSRFLAMMSHEVRTPMNGVIGFANLLQQTRLDPEQKEYVDLICRSGESLLVIINDILDYSKIEAGKIILDRRIFSPKLEVEACGRTFLPQASRKGISLSWHVTPNVPNQVSGDSIRLGQILSNLVGNAIKFTESGSVDIVARLVPSDQFAIPAGKVALSFEVRDTGIGIAEEAMERLFQPFTQIDATALRTYGGTGLGLVIAKSLTELMDGKILVESIPGKGTSFTCIVCFEQIADPLPKNGEKATEY